MDYDQDKSWFANQLTKAKRSSGLWVGFADALQEMWDLHVHPVYDRVEGMRSYFSMHPDDLKKRINEMGNFFYFSDAISDEDLPLAMMQKLDEIHFKKTDLPLKNSIAREFKGLKVQWQPLYAPKVITPSGSKDYTKKVVDGLTVNALRTEQDISDSNEDIDNYFMTSRGVIEVNSQSLANAGYTSEQFSKIVSRVITPLIPMTVVYDGERLLIHYDILEPVEVLDFKTQLLVLGYKPILESIESTTIQTEVTNKYRVNNSIPSDSTVTNKFDRINLDNWPLDLA